MKEARYYTVTADGVKCDLCPHRCMIREGGRGLCRSRECRGGKLYALSYGNACSLAVDPVEKKPLSDFLSGTSCLSVSCTGCNLRCRWCQNSSISQVRPEDAQGFPLSPQEVVSICLEKGLPSVALTYSEPLTWWEYSLDIASLAHRSGLRTILVTAGYIEEAPLRELLPYIDAANVDIKAMDDSIYREYCGATLAPVLGSILEMRDAGVHVEVTNLLVTGLNDSSAMVERLCRWMVDNGLRDTPLHLSRFFPRYRHTGVGPTPAQTLYRSRDVALRCGLSKVRLGNI